MITHFSANDTKKIVKGIIDYFQQNRVCGIDHKGKKIYKTNLQNHIGGYSNFPFEEITSTVLKNLIKFTTGKDIDTPETDRQFEESING